MAQLAKRTQTIIVHSHGQHGKDKDHHGHQYSPTLAQLQQQQQLALANESYREVGGTSDQQQDGKCVIPVFPKKNKKLKNQTRRTPLAEKTKHLLTLFHQKVTKTLINYPEIVDF